MAESDEIARGEAREFEWSIREKDEFTGVPEPLDEDTPITGWLSAAYKGDPITDESVVTLKRRERTTRADGRILWFAILGADEVTEALSGIATSGTAYEVIEIAGERRSRGFTVVD